MRDLEYHVQGSTAEEGLEPVTQRYRIQEAHTTLLARLSLLTHSI